MEGEQKCVAGETFSHAVSLGSLCVTASWLQGQGLRTGSGPFDWVHSSPTMVRHCLRDNFTQYLDRSLYHVAGQTIGHMTYSDMQLGENRKAVWLHHDPLRRDDDHALMARCVDRLRNVLRDKSSERKLFLLCVLVKSARALEAFRADRPPKHSPGSASSSAPPARPVPVPKVALARTDSFGADNPWAFGNRAEMRGLFHDLCEMGVRRFHLDVVYLCTGTASSVEEGERPEAELVVSENTADAGSGSASQFCGAGRSSSPRSQSSSSSRGGETLAIHELHLIGGHTGLRFKESIDERAFTELLLRRAVVSGQDGSQTAIQTRAGTGMEVESGLRRRFELRPLVPSSLDYDGRRSASRYGDDLTNLPHGKATRRARARGSRPTASPVPSTRRRLSMVTSRRRLWRKTTASVDAAAIDGDGINGAVEAAASAAAPKKRFRIGGSRRVASTGRANSAESGKPRSVEEEIAPEVAQSPQPEVARAAAADLPLADAVPVVAAVVASSEPSAGKGEGVGSPAPRPQTPRKEPPERVGVAAESRPRVRRVAGIKIQAVEMSPSQ
eukprot:TRINITY_DN6604_c0_g1_i1.p1 TRINITY_DN6604_c0_g1~~TRINITY_DN6604_c0_g1_i1.p1  ORF type:complete len:558 (+),score=71.44 TRINITY_DN6604_c0_g1_i1:103-1776(+)